MEWCHCCATCPYRDPIPAHQGQERVPWRWGSVEGLLERWHIVELLQESNERKVLGRSVFGEAPGWAGQGCAPNHRAGQISAFDFFPVTIQAGLFLTSTCLLPGTREVYESLDELLSALTWSTHSPADKIPSCSLCFCCVYSCGSSMFSMCILCLWLCVCTQCIYIVYLCAWSPEVNVGYLLQPLSLLLEMDLWIWSSLIWLDCLARMLWGIRHLKYLSITNTEASFAPSLRCGTEDPNSHRMFMCQTLYQLSL